MMVEHKQITFALLEENEGNYIQLGGEGILDGLKSPPSKSSLLFILHLRFRNKVIEGATTLEDVFGGVYLHQYRCRLKRILPSCNFNQSCRIFTPKEFKTFPIFS